MAKEFQVRNTDEFEQLVQSRDFRVYEALVSTILKNLKSKKRHHHVLSVVVGDEDAIYDITLDKKDFSYTLEESLSAYEKEEKYEECIQIQKAISFLTKKNTKKKK